MAQLPILFTKDNRALVRVDPLLKWQTRRTHGLDHINQEPDKWEIDCLTDNAVYFRLKDDPGISVRVNSRYAVGDELWMQEPYQVVRYLYDYEDKDNCFSEIWGEYLDDEAKLHQKLYGTEGEKFIDRKKPYMRTSARFMYKSLTRTWLLVKRVWVERTQDISWEDIIAEGTPNVKPPTGNPTLDDFTGWTDTEQAWRDLWDGINKKRGYGWDVNPWNFCYEFEGMEK